MAPCYMVLQPFRVCGHLCTTHSPLNNFSYQVLQLHSSVCHPLNSLPGPYSVPPSILQHKVLPYNRPFFFITAVSWYCLDPAASLPPSSFRACACTWQYGPSGMAHPHASTDLLKTLTVYRLSPCSLGSLTISP